METRKSIRHVGFTENVKTVTILKIIQPNFVFEYKITISMDWTKLFFDI